MPETLNWKPRRIEYCNLDILCHPYPREHFREWFSNYNLIVVKEPGYGIIALTEQVNSPEWQVEFGTIPIIDSKLIGWEKKILNLVLDNSKKWVVLINDTYIEFKNFRKLIQTLQ